MALRDDLRHLFSLHASPVRWPVALQAALAMGLPIAGFTVVGHPDLGLLTSSGAFLALYLAARSRHERILALPSIAVVLIASSATGVVLSASLPGTLTGLFAVAVAAATLALGFSVGPPGALFPVLVAGLAGHLAAPESLGGRAVPGGVVIALCALGCLVAYLVVLAPLLVPRIRRRDRQLPRLEARFELGRTDRIILARVAVASLAGVLLAAPLGIPRAYWVLLTVVAVLQAGHHVRLTMLRAVHRVLGTVVGLGVFALLALARPEGLWLVAVVGGLQYVVEIVVIRNYGLALAFITPLALTISTAGAPGSGADLAAERLIDTLVGAAIAVTVLAVALVRRSWRGTSAPSE